MVIRLRPDVALANSWLIARLVKNALELIPTGLIFV